MNILGSDEDNLFDIIDFIFPIIILVKIGILLLPIISIFRHI